MARTILDGPDNNLGHATGRFKWTDEIRDNLERSGILSEKGWLHQIEFPRASCHRTRLVRRNRCGRASQLQSTEVNLRTRKDPIITNILPRSQETTDMDEVINDALPEAAALWVING